MKKFLTLLLLLVAQATLCQERVIIIGAGLSGLTAAQELTPTCDVLILEARGRAGGRIYADRSFGIAVDMGASWIHHSDGNPLTEFCHLHGIATLSADYRNATFFPAKREFGFWEIRHRFIEAMAEAAKSRRSTADCFDYVANTHPVALWTLCWDYEIENATLKGDLSAEFTPYDHSFAGPDRVIPHGYPQITDQMAEGLNIHLGEVVRCIQYDALSVQVHTSKGSYQADRVIVTLPLGVLKAKTVEFQPPLPEKKLKAIDELGMGVLAKLNLQFEEAFWNDDALYFMHVPEEEDLFPLWINFHPISGAAVLSTQISGNIANALEHMPLEEASFHGMKVLKKMFGDSIPDPIGVTTTNWSYDPFSEGSYSYLPAGVALEAFDTLAEPVADRLFFAGEATHAQCYGSAHAAYLSGQREARRILQGH